LKTYRVLSIDGGGMRGYYSAVYLSALSKRYAKVREVAELDIGKSVNLIAGTSTGAILACALAKGVSLEKVAKLYRCNGSKIFPQKVPDGINFDLAVQLCRRPSIIATGASELERALTDELKETTVGDVWRDRGIALAIPAVEMSTHKSWVFKTRHLPNSKDRDGGYRLVDVCMASTAAPVYRSLAAIDNPDDDDGHLVFADGGLWANSPVLVGLIDALEMTTAGDTIEIYCLGTCPRPEGTSLAKTDVNMGLADWKFGAKVPTVANSAQEYAYYNMARMIARHVDRTVKIVQFPRGSISQNLMPYLDLDETSPSGLDALHKQATTDASVALSQFGDDNNAEGAVMDAFFRQAAAIN
jgi:hypothetical protein